MLIASGSGESLKIWNRHSCESIRTIPCDYALCCMFLPGDHSVLIGCKVREFINLDLSRRNNVYFLEWFIANSFT